MAMRVRGETVAEITGAVRAMRARMTAVAAPAGRDRRLRHRRRRGRHAERLHRRHFCAWPAAACRSPSTATARSHRAPAGADVLTALGVNVDAPLERLPDILRAAELRVPVRARATIRRCATPPVRAWSSAPARSSTCSDRWPIRRGVRRQLTGVFAPAWARPMAETLARAGHRDGLDRARPGPG